ncbi:MAG: hypothetical protein H6703_13575 [Myxococcales bacterium]|nr:hypothetical protein [Myxococcales bacterium]
MVARLGPTIFCEGVARGADVRLLEAARAALVVTHPLADRVELRAANAWTSLTPLLGAFKDEPSPVRAIRDRDFLPHDFVAGQRLKPASPFPLTRHCIESYLLDSSTFIAVAGVALPAYEAARDEVADEREWPDAAQGVLDQYIRQHRHHPQLDKAAITDRAAAITAVEASLDGFSQRADHWPEVIDVSAALDAMSADFHADGPLWARVDGKKLLSSLRDRFDPTGKLGDRDAFRDRLVNHAVLHPPPALRADLAALLETMQRR